MMIRPSFVALCAFSPFALQSCTHGVRLVHPLSDPRQAKVEESLIGRWDQPAVKKALEISRDPRAAKKEAKTPAGMLTLKIIDTSGESERVLEEHSLFVTVIGKERFFNIALPEDAKAADAPPREWKYELVKYGVKGATLEVWGAQGMQGVIERGLLKGEVRTRQSTGILAGTIDESYLTDSTENLAKFIAAGHSDELFRNEDPQKDRITFTKTSAKESAK